MLLDTREAAKMLGRNERDVRRMCERGDLRAVKCGRDWTIDATSVRAATSDGKGADRGGR